MSMIDTECPASPPPAAVLEMGLTHADFYRIFPRLVQPLVARYEGLNTVVEWPSGARLLVVMSPERIRRIAGLQLPYVALAFTFEDFSLAEEAIFMRRFAQAFHKGGG